MNIIKEVILLSLPTSIGSVCFLAIDSLNLIFIGHLNDPTKLSALGLGGVIVNMGATSVLWGLNCSLEALVSQAYGAGNLKLCGIYL